MKDARLTAVVHEAGAAAVFTYEEGEIVKKAMEYGPDAVYISFGGEQKMSYVAKITKRVVAVLADAGCKASLVLHVLASHEATFKHTRRREATKLLGVAERNKALHGGCA
ncbi:MAG: hypothetical protein ABWK05_05220 [Pyrobaculum sp.]